MNGKDVRVRQRGHRAALLFESRHSRRIGRQPLRQDLDGHLAFEPRVAGQVDLAHAAGAKAGVDFVGTEAGAGG